MKVSIIQRFFLQGVSTFALASFFQFSQAQTSFTRVSDIKLAEGFRLPPDSLQTSVYWYWISDNISTEGVIKDLQAMKSVGINRAFIGNIGIPETPYGKVKLFSDEWWEVMHTALKTATDLHIEIGIFNSPGWSQSGGPWIKPAQAMRYLSSSEWMVTGPRQIDQQLVQPAENFQDVRVLAFRAPKDYTMDGLDTTAIIFPEGGDLTLTLERKNTFTARSLVIWPGQHRMKLEGEIQVKDGNQYRTIRNFVIDRSNDELNTGFDPYGPGAISLPATKGNSFRIVFHHSTKGSGITKLKIRASPVVENYIEKTLGKMYPTPLPYWKEYQWPAQPEVKEPGLVIDPKGVSDISSSLSTEGVLHWQVPEGDWVILRTGMTPTKVTNGPATPEGRGLEVDKMSREHVAEHFNAFLGEIQRRIPAQDRKTWKIVVEDSYETGGQNWTDGFIEKFNQQYGYDALPYLPVFTGKVVGSEDASDRFLWDVRRFIADRVSYDYVGGLREVSHQHGLTTWLENYGHWGFPGEFLQYGGQSDEVAGEFWSEGELGNIENRAASSSAHIYGKTKVSAESFTAGGKAFARYPAMMKQRGDRFFTEGINNTLLHLYIQQPDDRAPGINAPFGNEFNRHNTWFHQLDLFTQYTKRCNMLLQQGIYVADVAYFIGEDAPKMTGIRDPELPKGYSFDYINAEVIENRLTVKDGKWVLPDGLSYRLLVLPPLKTMRPALLRRIRDLVREGGILSGPSPERSPSLQDYGAADQEVKSLAGDLWGNINGRTVTTHVYGKGMVIDGLDMQAALDLVKVVADCGTTGDAPLLFIHRTTADREIYFLSNQSDKALSIAPTFRTQYTAIQLWDAVTGAIRDLPGYVQQGGTTTVPIRLEGYQSAFIVLARSKETTGEKTTVDSPNGEKGKKERSAQVLQSAPNLALNFPEPLRVTAISGPWSVTFDTAQRGPLQPVAFDRLVDWTKRPEENIRNYSGTAVYRKSFTLQKTGKGETVTRKGETVFLDLGMVKAMAKVKVNGVYVGGAWTPPYRVDITPALKTGENKLEIEVVNTWVNRLIGDTQLPEEQRKTWTSINIYNSKSVYESSGLLGPVKLETMRY
ncbi:glycosyl hydrolase [Flavitalea flava]